MNTRKGFTLVELLVVIAILAILATVSVVGYTTFIERAERSNAETEAHQIETTIKSYTIAEMSYTLGTVEGEDDVVTTYFIAKDGKLYSITNEEDAEAETEDKKENKKELPKSDFVLADTMEGVRKQKDEKEAEISKVADEREEFNKIAKEQRKIRDEFNSFI